MVENVPARKGELYVPKGSMTIMCFNPPNALSFGTPEGCNGEFYKNRKQADGYILGNPSCINGLTRDRPRVPKDPKT